MEVAILWYVGFTVEKASEFPITSSETTEDKKIVQEVIECESFIVASSIDMFWRDVCIDGATWNMKYATRFCVLWLDENVMAPEKIDVRRIIGKISTELLAAILMKFSRLWASARQARATEQHLESTPWGLLVP